MIHDVNALGEFGDIEMPAVLTISSKKHDDSLTIQTDTDYDKDFLLEQMKKKHKNMSDFTTSDIFMSEKVETIFTTTCCLELQRPGKQILPPYTSLPIPVRYKQPVMQ